MEPYCLAFLIYKSFSFSYSLSFSQSAGFFATKDHIELKERSFSVFFLSAEALAKADVILRGYTDFKTALTQTSLGELSMMPWAMA